MKIDNQAIQTLFVGIVDDFDWKETLQGYEYWREVIMSLEIICPDIAKCLSLRPDRLPWPPAKGTCDYLMDSLKFAFRWSDSPQGYMYWKKVDSAFYELQKFECSEEVQENAASNYDRAMRGI